MHGSDSVEKQMRRDRLWRLGGLVLYAALFFAIGGLIGYCSRARAASASCDLPWGLPRVTDGEQITLACHAGYVSGVGTTHREARWVAYELTAKHDLGCFQRTGLSFKVDPLVPPQDQAKPSDYRGSGYDLGHLANNEDFAWDKQEQAETFEMTNVSPQLPGLNRAGWERLEEDSRAWALTRGDLEVFVGPIFNPPKDPDEPFLQNLHAKGSIGADKIPVPVAFFKVVIDRKTGESMGFVMPQKAIPKGEPTKWRVLIGNIESYADVIIPMPRNSSGTALATDAPLNATWPADLSGWRTAHRKACHK